MTEETITLALSFARVVEDIAENTAKFVELPTDPAMPETTREIAVAQRELANRARAFAERVESEAAVDLRPSLAALVHAGDRAFGLIDELCPDDDEQDKDASETWLELGNCIARAEEVLAVSLLTVGPFVDDNNAPLSEVYKVLAAGGQAYNCAVEAMAMKEGYRNGEVVAAASGHIAWAAGRGLVHVHVDDVTAGWRVVRT